MQKLKKSQISPYEIYIRNNIIDNKFTYLSHNLSSSGCAVWFSIPKGIFIYHNLYMNEVKYTLDTIYYYDISNIFYNIFRDIKLDKEKNTLSYANYKLTNGWYLTKEYRNLILCKDNVIHNFISKSTKPANELECYVINITDIMKEICNEFCNGYIQ